MRTLRLITASLSVVVTMIGATMTTAHADDVVAPTRIKASASSHWIAPGEAATITGTLLRAGLPYPGENVELLSRAAGSGKGFTELGDSATAADGTVSFEVSPTSRTIYRLRFTGDAGARRSVSHRMAVNVAAASKLAIAANSADQIRGQLTGHGHPLGRRSVTLQVEGDAGWENVVSQQTGPRGRVYFTVADSGEYRLHFAGGKRYLASTSPSLTIN